MKLLNLDELVEINREVTLLGENYRVAEQSVGMMLTAMKAAEDAKNGTGDEMDMFREMVKTTKNILPTCPTEIIEKMTIRQMAAVVDFATASDTEVVASTEASEDEVSSDEGKPE